VNLLNLYQRLYEFEWFRREQIQTSIATPLGILTLLGGSLFVLATGFESREWPIHLLFWSPFAVALVTFGGAAFFLTRAMYGHTYRGILYSGELEGHRKALTAYFAAKGTPEEVMLEFERELADRYVEAGDINGRINADRSEFVHQSTRRLIVAVIATALCAAVFVIADRTAAAERSARSPVTLEMTR
jgi:hypothetical protein